MGDYLTTGQMIDQLQEGEIAKSTDGEYEAYWDMGRLKFRDKYGDTQERIIKSNQERRWRILPKFVSFEEAMRAHKEGKIVYYYGTGDIEYVLNNKPRKLLPKEYIYRVGSTELADYSLYNLYKGHWSIGEKVD
jgi:hypothetical protein